MMTVRGITRPSPERMPLPTHEDETRLAEWIRGACGSIAADALLCLLERRYWLDSRTICPQVRYRLRPEILAAIRLKAAEVIHRDLGGRLERNGMVVRSDGSRLWTELKP